MKGQSTPWKFHCWMTCLLPTPSSMGRASLHVIPCIKIYHIPDSRGRKRASLLLAFMHSRLTEKWSRCTRSHSTDIERRVERDLLYIIGDFPGYFSTHIGARKQATYWDWDRVKQYHILNTPADTDVGLRSSLVPVSIRYRLADRSPSSGKTSK